MIMTQQPLGPVRCPACGRQALPLQTRCLHCNARIQKGLQAETTAPEAIQPTVPDPLPTADGKCPGCGRSLPAQAVLCIECGYDLRTGGRRETVHALAVQAGGPDALGARQTGRRELPAGFSVVQRGLGFHYARLVLTLLALLVLMGLVCYGATTKARADDEGLWIGGLAALGIVVLAALFGLVGSLLCLWVSGDSPAWWLIFLSLLLDVLTLPLAVYLQMAGRPPLLGWVVAFVSWLLFMLFLCRLARGIDRPGEANELMALITRGVALLVGVPLLLVLLTQVAILYALVSIATAQLVLMISLVILVVQIIFVIKLLFSILGNIQTLRAAIITRLPGRGREEEG
jgi:hypothetical protein